MSKETSVSCGGGSSLLLVAFIVMKLTGVIGWSWWWVLAPLWGGFALVAAVLLIVGIVCGIVALFER